MQDPIVTQEELVVAELPAPPKEEVVPDLKEPEAATEKKEELTPDLPEGARLEDGMIVLEVEGSVFKGKTPKELIASMAKSAGDVQTYIRELKAKSVSVPEAFKGRKTPEAGDDTRPEPPVYDEILSETQKKIAKQYGVAPERLSWTDAEWIQFAEDQGWRDFQLGREINRVEAVKGEIRRQADVSFTSRNQSFVNDSILDDETERVRKIVGKLNVELSKDKYTEILESVFADKDNFDKNGMLRPGSVVDSVWAYIHSTKSTQTKTALQKQIEEDLLKAQKLKDNVTTTVSSPAPFKLKPKSYGGDYDKAAEDAKKEARLAKA